MARSVSLVEEIDVPEENHRPVTNHWQAVSYMDVSSTPRYDQESNSQLTKSLEMPKGVIRTRKSKDIEYNDKKKWTKEQTTIYRTSHRKLKIEQHELKMDGRFN